MKKYLIELLFLGIILSCSCIVPTSDVVSSPSFKLNEMKRIVVWRFRDGGRIANSGDIATTAIESAFLEKGFSLISYSLINNILSVEIGYKEGMALDSGMLTPDVLSKIKHETGADGLILGSVSESWCDMMWIPPCRIAVSFKLISMHTGDIVVSASISDEGFSVERAALIMAKKAVSKIR